MLDPALQSEILRLHFAERLSQRKIARTLGVNWKTVAAVLQRRSVKERRDGAARRSILEPYFTVIDEFLKEAPLRSAVNILQRLRSKGYAGGLSILRDHIRTVRPTPPKEAFVRIEYRPAEVAQVDWGEFGDVFGDGTKVHAFVIVSSYSGAIWVEFTLSQTLPTFLRCHERALRWFGGVHREYWYDNLASVVAERVGRLVRFNPRFLAYAGFHAFKPVAMNPGRGNEKGGVENAVKFVRASFWPGRTFKDIDDLNGQAREWREKFANRREHKGKGKIPAVALFEERPHLLPLRPEPYDTDDVVSCLVHSDHRVRFHGSTYTVPFTLVGKTLTVRADEKTVTIFYGDKRVARHERSYRARQDIRNPSHEEGLIEIKPGAREGAALEAVQSLGPNAMAYLDVLRAGSRSLKREIAELGVLKTVHGAHALEAALGTALKKGVVGVANVERLLRLMEAPEQSAPPLKLDEKLRLPAPTPDLRTYDALLISEKEEEST